MKLRTAAWVMSAFLAACAAEQPAEDAGNAASADAAPADAAPAAAATADAGQLACEPQRDTRNRASPYDSTRVSVGAGSALICYGRPSARGRTMIGGESVPYGRLWRTGANEPTIVHLDFPAAIAGIEVEPGSYSLYTVPGETEWTVIVNRAIDQWGHESSYTPEVEAQEVGRATVPAARTEQPVEQFTIRSESAGADAAQVILEWENTRVAIPLTAR